MLTNKFEIILQTNYLKMVAMVTKMNMTPNGTFLSYGTSMRMALGFILAEFHSSVLWKRERCCFSWHLTPCYDNQAHILVHTDWFLFLNKKTLKKFKTPNLFVSLKDIWLESLLFLLNLIIVIIS